MNHERGLGLAVIGCFGCGYLGAVMIAFVASARLRVRKLAGGGFVSLLAFS
jgi:hypothetical protein